MRMAPRALAKPVTEALQTRMAFIGGPRQVGKTTLAFSLLGGKADASHPGYLTWDHPATAAQLRKGHLPPDQPRVVLDQRRDGQQPNQHPAGHSRTELKGEQGVA